MADFVIKPDFKVRKLVEVVLIRFETSIIDPATTAYVDDSDLAREGTVSHYIGIVGCKLRSPFDNSRIRSVLCRRRLAQVRMLASRIKTGRFANNSSAISVILTCILIGQHC